MSTTVGDKKDYRFSQKSNATNNDQNNERSRLSSDADNMKRLDNNDGDSDMGFDDNDLGRRLADNINRNENSGTMDSKINSYFLITIVI